jgi:hypothetical protein
MAVGLGLTKYYADVLYRRSTKSEIRHSKKWRRAIENGPVIA